MGWLGGAHLKRDPGEAGGHADALNEVTWLLPVSKTDPQALEAKRSWRCVSSDVKGCAQSRPFYLLKKHVLFMQNKFGDGPEALKNMPLFPRSDCLVVLKAQVTVALEDIARRLNLDLAAESGGKRSIAHCRKVSGAQHPAELGIELWSIQLLFRWRSALTMRYVAEAPSKAMTTSCKRAKANATTMKACEEITNIKTELERLGKLNKLLRTTLVSTLKELRTFSDDQGWQQEQHTDIQAIEEIARKVVSYENRKADAIVKTKEVEYVRNADSGRSHVAAVKDPEVPPEEGMTACGWSFGRKGHMILTELPPEWKKWCVSSCLGKQRKRRKKEEKAQPRKAENVSSSDSSSSSDSDSSNEGDEESEQVDT